MFKIVRFIILIVLVFGCFFVLNADYKVQTVDFLSRYGMTVNGAGPLLVQTDTERNRIILVNTNTSSISIINGTDYSVTNIPVKSRVPQYLKSAALAINKKSGDVYVIGNRSLHMVFPDKKNSISVDTGEQYEMAAINESNGTAFLVGRESKFLFMVDKKGKKIKRIPWVSKVEKMKNLNQTPPPPIRKVICDSALQKVAAVDGFDSTVYLFSAKSGKLLKKRKLAVKGGARWHMAGYDVNTHHIYTVIETAKRVVQEAVKIDIVNGKDTVMDLPGLHEGVGINYNPKRNEIYIPYDNDPAVHVVDFKKSAVVEVKLPGYGNDASAIDIEKDLLYISSWAYGDVEVVDLNTRRLHKRIANVGIIPHMFSMTFNPNSGKLYIPIGATAVNGSHGASLAVLNPETEKMTKIHTGWAPVALVEMKNKEGFLVFNSEDGFAEVTPHGTVNYHSLPCQFIQDAVRAPQGHVSVCYGPHQSYWPTVYIWAARNGIMNITETGKGFSFYDRRIPRQAHRMVFDKYGVLYALQNNWGKEKQFLAAFPDEVRFPNLGNQRMELEDTVIRETTQRIVKYDESRHWLYVVRLGETNEEPGILQIVDLNTKKTLLKYPVGLTPTDLVFDDKTIYISNFDSDTVTAVTKSDFSVQRFDTGEKPFKLAFLESELYCLNHNGNSLQSLTGNGKTYPLPFSGKPSQLFSTGKKLIITGHTADAFYIFSYAPSSASIKPVHKSSYPYGETTVDTDNTAFYVRAQFADAIFELNRIEQDASNRVWITDYLSGRLYILY